MKSTLQQTDEDVRLVWQTAYLLHEGDVAVVGIASISEFTAIRKSRIRTICRFLIKEGRMRQLKDGVSVLTNRKGIL